MNLNELTVVIVTFKSFNKISACIKSIPSSVKVYVIENSKDKEFKKQIENKYPNVSCILSGENKGYAVANNIGLKKVKTQYALVLNPDTILEENALKNFFISSEKNNDFWLIGPNIDQKKILKNNNNNLIEVNNLKGFAIFINIKKFNQDFFDENYFLYFEEIDLCKKVKLKGGKIYLDNSIIVYHEGSGSVHISEKIELEKNRNWHWMWSTFYYHKKYKGFLFAFLLILPKLLSSIVKTFFYKIIKNKEKEDIYFSRMSGLVNSIFGKKSWYRPSID
tara:strand:- start:1002 stop:1835 length:834 start_codon:yes stop_codon:yes gene_type:complete